MLRKDLGSVLSLFCFDILSTFVLVPEYVCIVVVLTICFTL